MSILKIICTIPNTVLVLILLLWFGRDFIYFMSSLRRVFFLKASLKMAFNFLTNYYIHNKHPGNMDLRANTNSRMTQLMEEY